MELVCGGWCCGGQWWGVEGSVQASLLPDTVLLVRVFVETLRFLLINGHRVFTCRACVGGVQTSLMYSLITNITPRRIVTEITTLTARTDIVALFELQQGRRGGARGLSSGNGLLSCPLSSSHHSRASGGASSRCVHKLLSTSLQKRRVEL